MWVIRCNGELMGRFRDLDVGVREMKCMIDMRGKVSDKWSLGEE